MYYETVLIVDLLEDWDRIGLRGTLQCNAVSFRDFKSSALVYR